MTYLKRYNYENFVNNYSKFLINKDTREFIVGVSSDTLISLFDFDRTIGLILLKPILEIERIITTTISYIIPKIFINHYKTLKNGNIFLLNNKEFRNIFSNWIEQTDNNDYIYLEKIDLEKNVPNSVLNFNPSIWKISPYWSFSTVKDIFNSLSIQLKKEIIKELNLDFKWYEFSNFIDIINKIRNRICHNNVIYEFNYSPKNSFFPYPICRFLKRKLNIDTNKIRIYHVIKLIDIFLKTNYIDEINCVIYELKDKFNSNIYNDINKSEVFNNIIKYMRFISKK